MIGYHAVSVIADAMAKGIKGFDYDKAYAAAKHSAELDHFGLAAYKKRGYISMEDENESVSKTLEYAYDDWCISQMATSLRSYWLKRSTTDAIERSRKYGGDAELYSKRARYFENLFDPTTGFMRPKKNGGFVSPFAPNEVTFNFTEGNSWVYSFFVPHDIKRLIELQGGSERFAAKLDELFTTKDKLAGREQPDITGLIGQYAHGNEPSHHIAYLYNYAGQPWKTQKYVRQILNDFYKPTPDGLIGNEDCGQMSAWYILSASGFYPVAPGAPTYSLGTPLFPRITYHLENGKTFTIKAPAVVKPDEYLRAVEFNGKGVGSDDLTHGALMAGGMLEFRAFPIPPVAEKDGLIGTGDNFVAVPRIEGRPVFDDRAYIFLRTTTRHAKIFYTTDGRDPVKGSWTLYDAPFRISQTTIVKAVSIGLNGDRSLIADGKFIKKPNNWTVAIDSKYNRQYTGGGDEGLIDGIRGTVNFASGEWQGYQPQDLVATIDLQKETTVSKLGGGFLQNARSWIWMPTRIEFELSIDGVNFTRVADIKTDIDTTDMKEQIRDFVQSISPVKARYVRIHAHNLGKIPSWHPGAGEDAFIFVDEIIVQ